MLNLMRISQQNNKAIPDPWALRQENHLKNMAGEKQSDESDGVDEEPETEAVSLRMTEEKKPERRRHEGRPWCELAWVGWARGLGQPEKWSCCVDEDVVFWQHDPWWVTSLNTKTDTIGGAIDFLRIWKGSSGEVLYTAHILVVFSSWTPLWFCTNP